jgi:hypothetical protein
MSEEKRIVGHVVLDGISFPVVSWDLSNDGMLLLELMDGREIFELANTLDFHTCSGHGDHGQDHAKNA